MTDTDKMLTPEEIKDTKALQLASLRNFMFALNYKPVYGTSGLMYFESDCRTNKGRSTVSIVTAVNLHNGTYTDWHGKKFKEPFDFDAYKLKRALASRIVQVVNLQKNKKTGIIKPTSHIVKFMEYSYYNMWINSKVFPF